MSLKLRNATLQRPRVRAARRWLSLAATAATVTLSARAMGATVPVTGTWSADADGNWTDPSNWAGGIVPGIAGGTHTGVGDIADFLAPINLARTVTLSGTATVGTLAFDAAAPYTLTGAGPLTLQATGTAAASLVVTATNGAAFHVIDLPLQVTGTTLNASIAANTGLELGGPAGFNFGNTLNLTGGGTLRLNAAGGATNSLGTVNLTGSTLEVGAGNVVNAPSRLALLNVKGGTMRLGNGAQFAGQLSITNGATVDVPAGATATWTGGNANGDTWTKTGGGTLQFSGTSSVQTTTVALNSGELLILPGWVTQTGSNSFVITGTLFNPTNLVLNGGTLAAAPNSPGFAPKSQIALNGDVQLGDAAFPGTMTLGAPITLGTNQSQYTITTPSAGNSIVLGGGISDGGRGRGVTYAGSGLITLNGSANSYAGPTIVAGGTVRASRSFQGPVVIGSPTGSVAATMQVVGAPVLDNSDVTIHSSGTLDLSQMTDVTVASLAGDGAITFGDHAGYEVFLYIGGSNSTTFTGTISGTGAVTKGGTGTLTLGGSGSTFWGSPLSSNDRGRAIGSADGGFKLQRGSIALASDQALGIDRFAIDDTTDTTSVSAVGGPRTLTNVVSLSHYATFNGSNPMAFGSLIIGYPGAASSYQLRVDADTAFNGPLLAWNASAPILKSGAGTLTLNVPASGTQLGFRSTLSATAGTLRLASFPASNGVTAFNISNATLDFTPAGTNVTLAVPIRATNATVLGSLTLQKNASLTGTGTVVGNLTFAAGYATSPVTGLSGTLTVGALDLNSAVAIAGTISGAGAATVEPAGLFQVNGTLNKPVNALGGLAGTGTITGPVTLTGPSATVSSAGTLHTGDLVISGGAALAPAFSGTSASRITVTGAVDLGSDDVLAPTGTLAAAPIGQTYVLVDNDGTDAISGRLVGLANDGDTVIVHTSATDYTLAINYHYDADGDGANNDLALTYLSSTPTPEPSAAAGAIAAMAGAFVARRRRRQRGQARALRSGVGSDMIARLKPEATRCPIAKRGRP